MAVFRRLLLRLPAAAVCLGMVAPAGGQSTPRGPQKPSAPAATAKATAPAHPGKTKKQKPVPAPPAALPPQEPPTLAKLPPGRPRVLYRGGLLSISSDNSTMADILSAVRAQTGATIELPPGTAGAERVVTRLGPAPADQVLAKLLTGSRFDYVILGSNGQPGAVKTVVLRPRQGAGPAEEAAAPAMAVPPQARFQAPQPNTSGGIAADNEEAAQPEAVPEEAASPDDAGAQSDQEAQPDASSSGQNPNQPVKTPEELLQELQRMQQIRQQQEQQPQQPQGQGNPPPDASPNDR